MLDENALARLAVTPQMSTPSTVRGAINHAKVRVEGASVLSFAAAAQRIVLSFEAEALTPIDVTRAPSADCEPAEADMMLV